MTGAAGHRRIRVSVLSVTKRSRQSSENEDSAAADAESGRFAVADGASTSARPEVWSRLLVHAYVGDGLDPCTEPTLGQLRRQWWGLVAAAPLPWYASAKLAQGGASTFAGLALDRARGCFEASTVGDSCVFQFRDGRLLVAVPIAQSDAFSRFTQAVSTRVEDGTPDCRRQDGEYRPGDVFVLATDAMSQFLLDRYERNEQVPAFGSAADFPRRVEAYRRSGLLQDDDTTICVVRS